MRNPIDAFLNNITMYRLVFNGLIVLTLIALVASAFGMLPFTPLQLVASLAVFLATCGITNAVLAKAFRVPTNIESWAITALILVLVTMPPMSANGVWPLVATGGIAMASKFIFAWHRKHLANPAAVALVIMGALGSGVAIWWVGSAVLLPAVLVLGLLIVRKIRRFAMLLTFIAFAVASVAFHTSSLSWELFGEVVLAWPLVFFGTIMLTEPLTTPPTRPLQIAYGAIVGLLFGAQFHIGPIFATPELALVIGNVFSYIVSAKVKLRLTLTEKKEVAENVQHFTFTADRKLAFAAGQYLEWTLPLRRPDGRGNRRYFTIASAPTEETLQLGVRVQTEKSSKFKEALMQMQVGDSLLAGQLAGDFTLPSDAKKKLVFIAGGIGVTPFRSMVKYLVDRNERRDVTLYYAGQSPNAFAYKELFDEAEEKIGMKTVYILSGAKEVPASWKGESGYITAEMLARDVPDFRERTFFLSGPNAMVQSYKDMLLKAGIARRDIVTDYFPGF